MYSESSVLNRSKSSYQNKHNRNADGDLHSAGTEHVGRAVDGLLVEYLYPRGHEGWPKVNHIGSCVSHSQGGSSYVSSLQLCSIS